MKLLRMAALALSFGVSAASAQTATRATQPTPGQLQAAQDLMSTMHMDQVTGESVEQMMQAQLRQNPSLLPFAGTMRDFFRTYMSWEQLAGEMTALYASMFTEEELRSLTAFYRTPVGQKYVGRIAELTGKGAEIGQQRVQAHMPELQQMIAARMAELQGAGKPTP